MRTKLIAAIVAAGCLLGLQASAFAEDTTARSHGAVTSRAAPHVRARRAPQYYDQYGRYDPQGRNSRCDGTFVSSSSLCYPLDIPVFTGR